MAGMRTLNDSSQGDATDDWSKGEIKIFIFSANNFIKHEQESL